MKNFLQFIIPLLVIFLIGGFLFIFNTPYDDTKKLYVNCENISENFDVYSNLEVVFSKNNEKCNLDIKISNVNRNYITIDTKYLWGMINNELDKTEPKSSNIISLNEKIILYSYDEKTKYTFQYK